MENSEQQARIIEMGKLFVKELGIEDSNDTLSRWMAHFIAEKIELAVQLPAGENKSIAEKECFETILQLWTHRWSFPKGKRLLENFEPILAVLEKLDPKANEPFFYNPIYQYLEKLKKDNTEVVEYLESVVTIDKVARIWIEALLQQAAFEAKNENIEALLKNAINMPKNDDVISIRYIFDNNLSSDTPSAQEEDFDKQYKQDQLNARITELERFAKLNTILLDRYKKDLELFKE